MTRTALDLRGLSLTELQQRDAEIGDELDAINMAKIGFRNADDGTLDKWNQLLADRRQIRVEIESRRNLTTF